MSLQRREGKKGIEKYPPPKKKIQVGKQIIKERVTEIKEGNNQIQTHMRCSQVKYYSVRYCVQIEQFLPWSI